MGVRFASCASETMCTPAIVTIGSRDSAIVTTSKLVP
jgi:hypothetical protein